MIKTIVSTVLLINCASTVLAHDLPALFRQYVELSDNERSAIEAARDGRRLASIQMSTTISLTGLESVIRKHTLGAWATGTTILSCFYTTVPQQTRKKLAEIANDWLVNANLRADFGTAPLYRTCLSTGGGQIRIDIGGDSSFSQVGTDANLIDRGKHTLNIAADIAANPDSNDFYTTALHEWGHAFGFEHEHQSPISNCNFDKPTLYVELGKYGWDRATVDANFDKLIGAEAKAVNVYPFDPNSIMIYSLPSFYFIGGVSPCLVGQPQGLSDEDKKAMRTTYPSSALPISQKDLSTFLSRVDIDASIKANVVRTIGSNHLDFEMK